MKVKEFTNFSGREIRFATLGNDLLAALPPDFFLKFPLCGMLSRVEFAQVCLQK